MNAKEYFKKWFNSISPLSCKLLDFNETYITISQAIDFAEAYHKSETNPNTKKLNNKKACMNSKGEIRTFR